MGVGGVGGWRADGCVVVELQTKPDRLLSVPRGPASQAFVSKNRDSTLGRARVIMRDSSAPNIYLSTNIFAPRFHVSSHCVFACCCCCCCFVTRTLPSR